VREGKRNQGRAIEHRPTENHCRRRGGDRAKSRLSSIGRAAQPDEFAATAGLQPKHVFTFSDAEGSG